MTTYQKGILMKEFKANPYLTREIKHQLARSLNVSAKKIDAWYANRRFAERKEGLPTKSECS